MSGATNEPGAGASGSTDGGTTAPAGGVTVQVQPGAGGTAPEFQDPKALAERLERERRKALKDAGFGSIEEAKAARERLAAMEKAEAERAAAQLSELERAQKAAEEAVAARKAAETALAEERRDAQISKLLYEKGVKNVDYAKFLLERGRSASGDAEGYDYSEALSKALGDPMTRAALGIVDGQGAPAAPPQTVPASTTPAAPGTQPRPPVASPATTGAKSAREMTPQEWSEFKRSNGMF